MGGLDYLANNSVAMLKSVTQDLPSNGLVYPEDSLVRRSRTELNLSFSAQQFLVILWKIESEVHDLKPYLVEHMEDLRLIQHYLDRESGPLLRSWTGMGDTELYESLISFLRARLHYFRLMHNKRAMLLARKLKCFEHVIPEKNAAFFEDMGITKADVLSNILAVNGSLLSTFSDYYASAQFGDSLHDTHSDILIQFTKKQYYWKRYLLPAAIALQATGLGFILTPFFMYGF